MTGGSRTQVARGLHRDGGACHCSGRDELQGPVHFRSPRGVEVLSGLAAIASPAVEGF